MPRGILARARINVKTAPPKLLTRRVYPIDGDGPRLWNAKRRVKTKGLGYPLPRGVFPRVKQSSEDSEQELKPEAEPSESILGDNELQTNSIPKKQNKRMRWWRQSSEGISEFIEAHPDLRTLSQDVKDYITKQSKENNHENLRKILVDPMRYFSNRLKVPLSMRKQVYFPNAKDTVVLMRTPHLGPRYAAFEVPLTFNKLDLRAYLKSVYDVDVLHIRSVIIQGKVDRKPGRNEFSQGALYRTATIKKMTCLLAKPFVYPEEPENLDEWEHDDYWNSMKEMVKRNREEAYWSKHNPNPTYRKTIKEQAQQLLSGKTKWSPTWQNFPDNWRVMNIKATKGTGQNALPPPAGGGSSQPSV